MSTLARRANEGAYENVPGTSAWSMRERIEHAASLFLIENRERITGPEPFSASVCPKTDHRLLLLAGFDKLAGVYKARVEALLRVKGRIDHLRRSARALEAYKSTRLARFAMDNMLRDVRAELRVKEVEEQEILEGVFEIATEIVRLGRAK